ncbi:hypothetical protein [Sporosarcina sp. NPDC096371]|uniref:hypothetical protein n=1 Tax=Sporosarcina sp. NPDC096371 TaxID=3364530 RepID=UPI003811CE72
MNNVNRNVSDSLQLQQMNIFLRAELARHKHALKKYQDGYQHSVIKKLEQENNQLINEKEDLAGELYRLNKELVKRSSEHKEQVHLHNIQQIKQTRSIDSLQKTTEKLWTTNKQLTEENLQLKIKSPPNANNSSAPPGETAEKSKTLEQFEQKLIQVIQQAEQQLHTKLERLDRTNQKQNQLEKTIRHLLTEIEQKNNTIGTLQHELATLKKKGEQQSTTAPIDNDMLMQLDRQIKELLAQSMEFEEKLDAKLIVLSTLEHELDQLTSEINGMTVLSPLMKKS